MTRWSAPPTWSAPTWRRSTPRVLVVADEGDEVLLDGLAVRRVPDGARADAIVLLSVRPRAPLTEHLAWVTTGVARGLPVYCPSADLHSVRPDGVVYGMAELVAEYRARGGTVVNFGKPEPPSTGTAPPCWATSPPTAC